MTCNRLRRWGGWIVLGGIVALHAVLKHLLADTDFVAVLLSRGAGASFWTLAGAGLFVLARVLVVLLLPGILGYAAWVWAARRWCSLPRAAFFREYSRPPASSTGGFF